MSAQNEDRGRTSWVTAASSELEREIACVIERDTGKLTEFRAGVDHWREVSLAAGDESACA